jgi:hypothetical protein
VAFSRVEECPFAVIEKRRQMSFISDLCAERRTIGGWLILFGMVFMGLGVMLFFDRALLILGNILFLAGIPFFIGIQGTLTFFNPFAEARRSHAVGILSFVAGIALIFMGWRLGMLLEMFGLAAMLKSKVHHLFGLMMRMGPGMSWLASVPFIGPYVAPFVGGGGEEGGVGKVGSMV